MFRQQWCESGSHPWIARKKYDLKPGKKLVVVDYGGVLGLVPALEDPLRQSAGLLAQEGKSLTQALMDEHRLEREGG